jgi:7-carboxy-7-deazaguanine synthase (Cx14CxxC type)
MYSIKEIFYSLQGEGHHSGRVAIFVRFAGCNLWNGLERDKANSSCPFCDTDFVGVDGQNGGKYPNAGLVAEKINNLWHGKSKYSNNKIIPYVVFTGGEPLLQLDSDLIDQMHNIGFEVAVETNGSLVAPDNIDWICVSPKADMELKIKSGNELKLLYPQAKLAPDKFTKLDFENFYLQPIDELGIDHKQKTLAFCLENPQWRYSLQLHKILDID